MVKEISIHGRGGQGSLVLAQFMAIAALEDGKHGNAFPLTDYLKAQKRFSHLFTMDEGREGLDRVQALADENIEKYGLLKRLDNGDSENTT